MTLSSNPTIPTHRKIHVCGQIGKVPFLFIHNLRMFFPPLAPVSQKKSVHLVPNRRIAAALERTVPVGRPVAISEHRYQGRPSLG